MPHVRQAPPASCSHCAPRTTPGSAPVEAVPAGAGRYRIAIDIPAEAPATRLGESPVTYRELAVDDGRRAILLPAYHAP